MINKSASLIGTVVFENGNRNTLHIGANRNSEQLKAEEAAHRRMRLKVFSTCKEFQEKIAALIAERDKIIDAHRAEYDAAVEIEEDER